MWRPPRRSGGLYQQLDATWTGVLRGVLGARGNPTEGGAPRHDELHVLNRKFRVCCFFSFLLFTSTETKQATSWMYIVFSKDALKPIYN